MIVLTIMASIMGLVGVVASNAIERGKVREAQIQAGQLANAVEEYYVYVDEWPDSLSDLVNPPGGVAGFVEEVPKDPWNNDYRYDRSEQQVCSNGKDGSSGGSDDICSEADELVALPDIARFGAPRGASRSQRRSSFWRSWRA